MSKIDQIEEMAKVIKSSLDGLGNGNFNFTGIEFSTMLAKALCAADVVEVRHGEWRDRYGEKYANRLYVCSLCEEVAPEGTVYDELDRPLRQQVLSPYCPNCGAKMNVENSKIN